MNNKFNIGDRVKKIVGWKYFGVVVSAFKTMGGELRYVVQNTSENDGQLFIFNESQLVANDEYTPYEQLQSELNAANYEADVLRGLLEDCRAGVPSDGAIYAQHSKVDPAKK